MTLFKKAFLVLASVACFSIAAADTVYLSTPYSMSVSGWGDFDDEYIYVAPHSVLTVTDCFWEADPMEYLPHYTAQECELYFDNDIFVNDSEVGVYFHVELSSAVYIDSWDVIHSAESSAWLSYEINPIEE
jgi:hypothetical protein